MIGLGHSIFVSPVSLHYCLWGSIKVNCVAIDGASLLFWFYYQFIVWGLCYAADWFSD